MNKFAFPHSMAVSGASVTKMNLGQGVFWVDARVFYP
jgi:hypothetical protein